MTCSNFFKSVLEDAHHCEHPIIFLRGVQAKEMQTLIDFMYTGKICVPKNELESLMETAKSLDIKGLGSRLVFDSGELPSKRLKTDDHNYMNQSQCPNQNSTSRQPTENNLQTSRDKSAAVCQEQANASENASILKSLFASSHSQPSSNFNVQNEGSNLVANVEPQRSPAKCSSNTENRDFSENSKPFNIAKVS